MKTTRDLSQHKFERGDADGFVANEDGFDRRLLLRLAGWAVAAIAAVVLAVVANKSVMSLRRDQLSSTDLIRQTQQMQAIARDSQSETRRLAATVETLNVDRDRLYARLTALEQGIETVTGSIRKSSTDAAALPAIDPASAKTPPPSPPLMASPSIMAPPDQAARQLAEPTPEKPAEPPPALASAEPTQPVARTEFGIDLGTASTMDGLRALWRQLAANPALANLRPLAAMKERPGAATPQLRLVAGPVGDAAAAARLCASLPGERSCEPTLYDGQRLALTTPATAQPKATPIKPRRKPAPRPAPVPADAAPKPQQTTSFLGR